MKTVLISTILVASISAQDLVHHAAAQRRPVILENATIHVGDGSVIAGGTIWFDGGLILGVAGTGANAALLPNAERIEARGLHVYPGMISANTTLGLNEIGSVPATQDYAEIGDITPEARAAVAVNPDSTAIPVTRTNGVLVAGVLPSGGLIPGRMSVVQLAGWTWEDMSIEPDAGVVVEWPSLTPRRSRRGPRPTGSSSSDAEKRAKENREKIDRAFRDARAYHAARSADEAIARDLRWEALGPVLRGEKPVFLRADRREQILSAVSWALDLGLKPTILGGGEAHLCIAFLKANDVGVVLHGTHRLPQRRDTDVRQPFALPAQLERAGIRWCLATTGGFSSERNLPYHAATAVAYGLPVDRALRAVTLSAAELLGVGKQLGSLEKGKRATLIVTNGHPLEMTTSVRMAFIDGRRIDLSNKHTQLAEKYRAKYRQLGLLPADDR